jgi:hypothetical protein
VDVADLEPDVLLGEGTRWVVDNILEALGNKKERRQLSTSTSPISMADVHQDFG